MSASGISQHQLYKYFPNGYADAVRSAGLEPNLSRARIDDDALLEDWGNLVRALRHIPTKARYAHDGKYSADVFDSHFGPWSAIPEEFREHFGRVPEWADVLALLPPETGLRASDGGDGSVTPGLSALAPSGELVSHQPHTRLVDRPTYGNPIDFRGLRHEPVNEQGVVFLFGMVASELGYMVEALQQGFPDCEAKRQVGPGQWQRVRIEFEYESRNFRDHGHSVDTCDVVVCWHHNWAECPIEVVELSGVIETLAKSDE
jgi:hypothetical protein